MYIKYDKSSNSLILELPDNLVLYHEEVMEALTENFKYEAINQRNLIMMDQFISDWFKERNISS